MLLISSQEFTIGTIADNHFILYYYTLPKIHQLSSCLMLRMNKKITEMGYTSNFTAYCLIFNHYCPIKTHFDFISL